MGANCGSGEVKYDFDYKLLEEDLMSYEAQQEVLEHLREESLLADPEKHFVKNGLLQVIELSRETDAE